MAIVKYSDSGGGGTGKKATYSTQKRTYATYGKSKPVANTPQNRQQSNYASQYSADWAKGIQYPNQNNNKPNNQIQGKPFNIQKTQVQPDRWATAPNVPQYQNNYAAMLKKQQQQSAYDKWITRNRELRNDLSGAPIVRADGYRYILPGGGYVPEAMNAGYNNTPSNSSNSYAGGGWGDYGGYGGYGGGGGGGGYSSPAPEWWLNMTTWKV